MVQSDRQSKNYDEATKAFMSRSDDSTRSKRDPFYETIAGENGISSKSHDGEETYASHGSGGISYPIAEKKRKTIVGQSSAVSSNDKNVDQTHLQGVSAPYDCKREKKRKIQPKPSRSVGSLKNNIGYDNGDMDLEENDCERVSEAEFKNMKTHSMSKIGVSTSQEENERFSAGRSCSYFGRASGKRSADLSRYFSPENVIRGSNKGKNAEYMVCKESEIERRGKVKLSTKKTHSMSKIRPSTKQGIKGGHFAATPSRNVGCSSKNIFCGSSSSEDNDGPHFDQRWSEKSCPILEIESDSEDMESAENGIEKVDEAEIRNLNSHFVSKIRPSMARYTAKGHYAASSSKNIGLASKKKSSANLGLSFSTDNSATHSDPLLEKSSRFVKKGNNNQSMNSKKIKIQEIDGSGFKSKISPIATNKGPSTRQGVAKRYYAANRRKNVEILKEVPVDSSYGSFSSEDAPRDSGNEQTDKPSSFSEKGKNSEVDFIEIIDGAEFRNKATHFKWKTASSKKHVKGTGRKISTKKINEDKTKKIKVPVCSTRKKNDEAYVKNSFVECSSSYLSSHSDSESLSDLPDKDKIISSGGGIANRTRSKVRNVKKPSRVDSVSLDTSNDSDPSPANSGSDDDLEVETSFNSDDIERVGPFPEACDAQSNTLPEVSAEKSKDCNKKKVFVDKNEEVSAEKTKDCNQEEVSVEKGEANSKEPTVQMQEFPLRKNQEEVSVEKGEANSKEPTVQRQEFPLRKSQFSHGSSSREKACKKSEVREGKKEINRTVVDDANAEEILKEKSDPKSADFHGENGKNEKARLADENEKPITKMKQVPSKKHDFCRMLASSILGKGPLIDIKEKDEETKKTPAPQSQTQNTLPLKFRFEDEVPKEVDKTESEKEIEGLFAELEFCWTLDEMGSFNYTEADQENEDSPAEETQHARCSRGMHDFILKEDEGLVCLYCHHVELGPKEIFPQWADRPYRESGRRRRDLETGRKLELDEIHFQSSPTANDADFNSANDATVWSLKPGIRESMYQHQQEGFEFLWKNLVGSINLDEVNSTDSSEVGGCIISHAPGTGKTRLTIVFIETYLKRFPDCRPVIIAPAGMLLTWEEEFKKWDVEFPFLNLNNPELLGDENQIARKLLPGRKRQNMDKIRMVKIYLWTMRRSVLGISYSLFEKLTAEKYIKEKGNAQKKKVILDDGMKDLRKILLEKPGLVVLDEGHTPRNQRSNIWNVLLKLQTEKRVILSGTPFQNNFGELFNTLRIVRPAMANILAQERTFAEMIASRRISSKQHKGNSPQSTLLSEDIDRAVEKLKISMSPFVHVHKGTILKQSLPGLRDCVVRLKPPPLQKSLIERLEGSTSTFEFEHKVALISVHPYLFKYFESTPEERIGIDMDAVEASKLNPNEGVKTKFILEFVRLSHALNEKVLIFSQYIQPLELIKEQLKETFKWVDGKQILQMQGRQDQKHRQTLINVFNDPQSESKVMLAATKCCSEGISLVGASRVILLDVVWNPSVEMQAICRAYRIGQKKFVYTYHMMTSGTTEADKYCRQAEKERLSELVFTSSSNESNKKEHPSLGFEDKILEEMVGHVKLKEMFEKIINQPKDADLIQTFGLTS